ncbi:hypothetical protein DFH94DRAFT_703322 [Russula ochroleuca]|uniref:Uncharacterized protein n=1 Tax=Russula ochroleuca TaxID=152965 RepID=A0A9P5N5V1_9AGAM|nr:hypothetical protein DFH94DRAFT_703322 [Russula ochroleuca]
MKLTTLRPPRFQDLMSDLRYELARRYPECKEEVTSLQFRFGQVAFYRFSQLSHTLLTSPGSTYDNLPFPGIPNVPPGRDRDTRFGGISENYPSGSVVVRTTTTLL